MKSFLKIEFQFAERTTKMENKEKVNRTFEAPLEEIHQKLQTILRMSENKHEIANGLVNYFKFDRPRFFNNASISHFIAEIRHIKVPSISKEPYTLRETFFSLLEAVHFLSTICHLPKYKQERLFKLEPVQYGREGNWCSIGICSCGDMNNHLSEYE